MNQALYAHMNNKRKMKKKRNSYIFFKVASQIFIEFLSYQVIIAPVLYILDTSSVTCTWLFLSL
jgi:hypothetical protein